MEVAWKRGVGRLAEYVAERLAEMRTSEDWARYTTQRPRVAERGNVINGRWAAANSPTVFREPSEGAQKLFVNLFVVTVVHIARVFDAQPGARPHVRACPAVVGLSSRAHLRRRAAHHAVVLPAALEAR